MKTMTLNTYGPDAVFTETETPRPTAAPAT